MKREIEILIETLNVRAREEEKLADEYLAIALKNNSQRASDLNLKHRYTATKFRKTARELARK